MQEKNNNLLLKLALTLGITWLLYKLFKTPTHAGIRGLGKSDEYVRIKCFYSKWQRFN